MCLEEFYDKCSRKKKTKKKENAEICKQPILNECIIGGIMYFIEITIIHRFPICAIGWNKLGHGYIKHACPRSV